MNVNARPPIGYHELTRVALGWVLEDETWPQFLAWARERAAEVAASGLTSPSEDAGIVSPEFAAWLQADPELALAEARRGWLMHSPLPVVRQLAERLAVADMPEAGS